MLSASFVRCAHYDSPGPLGITVTRPTQVVGSGCAADLLAGLIAVGVACARCETCPATVRCAYALDSALVILAVLCGPCLGAESL